LNKVRKIFNFACLLNKEKIKNLAKYKTGKGAMLLAHAIYIYFCFIGFYFIHFLVEMFGKDKLYKLLTTTR